ncbi:peptidylprolyl isomerase [Sedimentibacter hydroxybenzoicus DSM 7310]|uniref:Peptidylprolyl isomerase n=1 Tax=Sedimentibacter hydroxybenzoicus DSM 7310 TaxID=1123245 RepID=A0A974BKZ5_SEDHY|nr:peptidylprolyl isomerase [Sedimentibacter hydroxybenzoicus]NYB74923.1 peptidylprolyl isomerase [Sedimentibacter hydroxybenzoicus DSM 7310]
MSKLKKLLALTICFTLVLAFTGCDKPQEITEDGVVATVNGKPITQEELDMNYEFYIKMNPAVTKEEMLDKLIMDILMVEAAQKSGISVTEEQINDEMQNFKALNNSEEDYQKFLKDNGLTEEFLRGEIEKEFYINHYLTIEMDKFNNPTDENLQAIFDEYKMQEEVRASHILVNTEDEAKAVIERINEGEKFEDVAKEVSIDGSAATGGDLGYFSRIRMVKPFSDAAFSMEIGDISQPVESEFGYHVIQLTDKKTDEEKTIETERDTLSQYYTYLKYNEMLDSLKNEADIVIK